MPKHKVVFNVIACTVAVTWPCAQLHAGDTSAESKVEDPCEYAFEEMALMRSWTVGNETLAAFQIRIATIEKQPIVIAGWRKKDGFHVEYPDASFQFRDLTGQWNELPIAPGTFMARPDRLSFSYDKRVEVLAALPSSEITEKAIEWRMTLRDSVGCRRSLPFRVKQKRGPVEGYISDPVPEYWNKESEKPCDGDQGAKQKKK